MHRVIIWHWRPALDAGAALLEGLNAALLRRWKVEFEEFERQSAIGISQRTNRLGILMRARTIHPSLAEMSGSFMARNRSGLPYHPGAERYYREMGLLK